MSKTGRAQEMHELREAAISILKPSVIKSIEAYVKAARQYQDVENDSKNAYLYKLTFPNGLIYIGCTSQNPFLRLYGHATQGQARDWRRSEVFKILNKYNEVCIKILVYGSASYMTELEKAAIMKFRSNDPMIGYNRQIVGRPSNRKNNSSNTPKTPTVESAKPYNFRDSFPPV